MKPPRPRPASALLAPPTAMRTGNGTPRHSPGSRTDAHVRAIAPDPKPYRSRPRGSAPRPPDDRRSVHLMNSSMIPYYATAQRGQYVAKFHARMKHAGLHGA